MCFGGEQNRKGVWAPKRTVSTQLGWGRYKWYQSHFLARSVDPTREDACTPKGVDCRDPKGGLAIHGIPYRLGKHIRSDFPLIWYLCQFIIFKSCNSALKNCNTKAWNSN